MGSRQNNSLVEIVKILHFSENLAAK